ncbi:hypothetical protein [Chitinophaga alhagiae]|nr:hypothetical protein [Chitinophaga alhagiae]
MKYQTAVICCALLMAACGPNTSRTSFNSEEQPDSAGNMTSIEVKPLQGYFVKNTVVQGDSVTCWVINSPQQQDSILAPAKTMTNTIDTLDFANNIITAVVLRPSELTQDIQLSSGMVTENEVHLHFAIRADTPKRTFTAAALWMGAVPRKPGIRTIKFYSGDQLIRSVPVTE